MSKHANRVRIIGGQWRRHQVRFAAAGGLRPTPDRVRETLFNWLAPGLPGAHCLDLYAGSGALGWEAASRGAAHVTMVEHDPRAVAVLQEEKTRLGAAQVDIVASEVASFLRQKPPQAFDVVFVDPPYAAGLQLPTLQALVASGWLAPEARVHVEFDAAGGLEPGPQWTILRRGRAGQVGHMLLARG